MKTGSENAPRTAPRGTKSLKQRRNEMLSRRGLDEKHRMALEAPTTAFWVILAITMTFTALGLVMVLSSSSVVSLHSGESAWRLFRRQVLWAFVGALGMLGAYKFPYQDWRKTKWLTVLAGATVFLNVVVGFVGRNINGARAWLQWGWFRFQPSEFLKIAVILYLADYLSKRHRYVAVKEEVLKHVGLVLGGTLVVVGFLQKDYGTALVFACIVGTMLFMAGVPWRFIGVAAGSMAVVGLGVLKMAGNASSRLTAFLDIEGTKKLDGYQVYQALLSIANGGLGGTGIGSGTSKWGYVPLAYSDFIFAVIAEELGIIGAIAVIGGFIVLAYFGIQAARGAREMHGAFIAGGVTAWLSFQMFINIGGIVGVMPMTGLTLPFMSYGGSSLAATMVGCGLLLNIARHMR